MARHGRLGHRVAQRIKRLVLGVIVVLMEVALAIAEFDCSSTAFTCVAAAIASPLNYSTTNRLLLPLAVANACACNGSCQCIVVIQIVGGTVVAVAAVHYHC